MKTDLEIQKIIKLCHLALSLKNSKKQCTWSKVAEG